MTQHESASYESDRYRAIFDLVNDAIFIHDADSGSIIDINQTALDMFSCSREDLIGAETDRFSLGQAPHSHAEALARIQAAREGKPQLFEWQAKDLQGNVFWVEVNMRLAEIADERIIVATVRDIDQRKQAEEEARRTAERLKNIISTTQDGIWELNLHSGKTYVNDRFFDILGYGHIEDGDGLDFYTSLVHPEDRTHFNKQMQRFLGYETDTLWCEHRIKTKRRGYRYMLIRGKTVDDETGNPRTIIGTITEISELKTAEEAYLESEQKYRTVVDNIGMGIALIDQNFNIVTANSVYRDIMSPELPNVIGLHCHRANYSRNDVCEDCPGQEAMAYGRPVRVERTLRPADGNVRDVAITACPLKNPNGEVTGFIEVIDDITERKQARAERDNFFNMSLDMLCIAGFDGSFRQISPSWTRHLGWSEKEILATPWLDLVHPDDQQATITAGEALSKGEPVLNFENRYRCKDGSYRWLSWNSFPVQHQNLIYCVVRDVTDSKCKDQALRESEKRFRSIVHSSPMGIYLYEIRGENELVLIDCNQTADEMTGIENRKLIGLPIEEAFPNLVETEVPTRYRVAARDGTPWHSTDFLYEDDRIKGAYDIYAFQTSPGRMAVMFLDVTEREMQKQAIQEKSAALEEAQAQLLAAIENSPAGILIADAPDVRIRVANSAALGIRGGTETSLTEIALDVHPDSWHVLTLEGEPFAPEDLPLSRAVLKGEICRNVQAIIVREDGERRWVLTNSAPIRDTNGEITSGIVVFSDITEQKLAEDALRDSEESLRITLNSIGDAVIATDRSGGVTSLNPVAEKLTGWTVDEAIGKPLEDIFNIVNAHSRHTVENPVRRVMREGEIVGLANHTVLISRNGEERQIADSGAPIRDASDKIVGVVLVFRDVTEEYQIQEQLRQAQKMDSIGQLAGGVAHDFNNMLGGILGAAELLELRLGSQTDRCRKYIDMIINTANRAAELTQKLLAFSRKGKVKSVAIDINEIVSQARDILAHTIDRRIKLSFDQGADALWVVGDPAQLQNAVLNLGINARDAMPGGGEVGIATFRKTISADDCRHTDSELEPADYACIRVTDSGHGIQQEHLQRIFEPFFTTKGVGEGTGLGLSAVYGTIKDHNGAITVNSELGAGTTFTILLPLAGQIDDAQQGAADHSDFKGSGNVLLVDDEEVIRYLAKEMLSEMGFAVTLAADGEEGLQTFKASDDGFDLVILDLVMPKMSGSEVFRQMREHDPEVRVVLASGFNLTGADANQLLHEGASGFIQKPYRQKELAETVMSALAGES